MISDTLVAAGFSRRSGALVRGLLVLCGVVMLLSAAPAWARQHRTSRLPVRLSTPSLAPASGGGHLIEIAAKSVRGALCQASVSVKDVTQQLVEVKVDRHGRAAWRWTILSTSPSGTWRIRIRCTHGRKSGSATIALLIVTSSSSSTGSIGDPASLETPVGTPAGKGGSTALQCGPFTSTVTQCTCLAYLKRSDIYNAAVAAGVPRGGNRVVGGDGTDYYVWDAEQWLVNAQRAGIPTGSQPVPGAIAVFGTANSAGYGHVQYVEQVASPTSIAVDECNYDWNGSCRYNHWENPEALGEPLQGYIYGGPAGSGPGSGATGPGTGPGGAAGPIDALEFIKLRNTGGTVEVHWDTLQGGSYKRAGDYTSDFSPGDAGNGTWQLFGSANGAPELGFIKLRNTGGTAEVHWDTLQGGSYKRAGDYTSDFSPGDADNGTWQLFGTTNELPRLGLVKLANTAGTVEGHADSLSAGHYARTADYTSDFSPADAGNGVWQIGVN